MKKFLKQLSPARIIAFGFLTVILLGSVLLILPFSLKDGVRLSYVDALYTSTSAVCVTGLTVVDTGNAFSPLGQFILGLLIQIGGLGVTSVGAGIILAMGKKINARGRNLIVEASNLGTRGGTIKFLRSVFFTTITIEIIGAIFSFLVFVKIYPPIKALGYSLFHSVAAFNNSGFDNLGLSGEVYNGVSLIPYQNNLLFNLVTCALIFFGGIGFLVIKEVIHKRFKWKKLSMHSRVVLSMSLALTIAGTLLLKITEDISWLGAFFSSVSARTAGFSSFSLSEFSSAGLLVMMILMFIGASPGSTGGGIKTSTFFALLQGIKSAATNKSEKAFHYSMPEGSFKKAAVITLIGLGVVTGGTYLMVIMDPELRFVDALFEIVSAFGTVGLSTGITTSLSVGSKILSMFIMFIGRLGPLTIATLWYFNKGERVEYPEGNIAIG
ncbi:MAG: H(+)-transporting ATPase [Clostridia bacterium]|nr:H(+)-transporting ATPase [Clostridia bacterium]